MNQNINQAVQATSQNWQGILVKALVKVNEIASLKAKGFKE